MREKITIIILTVVISVALTLIGVKVFDKVKQTQVSNIAKNAGVHDVIEIDYEIPEFSIDVSGIYDTIIDSRDLNNIKKYYIETVMDDGIYKFLYSYEGIKLSDVLELYELEDFKTLTIKSDGRLQVTFLKEEINDSIYLTFSKDGYRYAPSEVVALVAPEYMARYSITSVVEFAFD